jgi:biotin transport system substrate-specific component
MQRDIRYPTLAEALFPRTGETQSGLLRDALLVTAFSLLTAACAQISIPLPFTPVPITGQTLAVLLAGGVLGSRRGALALLLYLAEGMAGLPVFAGGNTAWAATRLGVPYIIGPTAGYLFAFPIAAFAVGWLAERGWDRNLVLTAVAMLVGTVIIYVPGVVWLARYVGPQQAVPLGLLPFIPGDLIKLGLAAAFLPSAWLLAGKFRPR